ncbi:MAG: DUF4006 family protein [Lachnospiraceae bacterium]|jgi:hypothetical protein|nr:DUF4006 family protein [Lachnospiraceae bacterium]
MRIITLNSIFKTILRKKKELILFMVAFVILFSILAVFSIRSMKSQLAEATDQYELDMAEYDSKIAEFDENEETLKANLTTIQKQYDDQNKYCNESVYMKLDGNKVQFGELQIQFFDGNHVAPALNYLNSSAFRSRLSSKLDSVDEEYLKEIVSATNNGTVITVTALHYDRKIVEQMKDSIKEIFIDWAEDIRREKENFEYRILSETVSVKTDVSIINAQNSALNNLTSYNSKLADTKKQIATNERNKERYIKETTIESVGGISFSDKVKAFIKYFILAMIVAIIADAGWIVLRASFGKKILSTDCFIIKQIPVSNQVLRADCDKTLFEKAATDLQLAMKCRDYKSLYVDLAGLEINDERQTVAKNLIGALKNRGLEQVHIGSVCNSDIEALEKMSGADMIALLVAIEGTTYQDLEKTMEYITKYQKTVSQVILWR